MHSLVSYKDIYQNAWPNHQDIRFCFQILVKIKYPEFGGHYADTRHGRLEYMTLSIIIRNRDSYFITRP
jgi:hypothetical protein